MRVKGPLITLRTKQYNSKWLFEPEFVSSFEYGKFVYFLFRENDIEEKNHGKVCFHS